MDWLCRRDNDSIAKGCILPRLGIMAMDKTRLTVYRLDISLNVSLKLQWIFYYLQSLFFAFLSFFCFAFLPPILRKNS